MSTYQFFSILIGSAQFILTGGKINFRILLKFIDFHNPLINFMKNVLVELPFSRKCEREADYIGLLLMASSCYNPSEAIALWKRMASNTNSNNTIPFLSTHPSHYRRIDDLRSWLPEANKLFEKSDCNNFLLTNFYNKSFNRFR